MRRESRFWIYLVIGLVFTGLVLAEGLNLFGFSVLRPVWDLRVEDRIAGHISSLAAAEREIEEGYVVDLDEITREREMLLRELESLGRSLTPDEARLARIDTSQGPFAPKPRSAPIAAAASPSRPAAAPSLPPLSPAALVSLSCGGSIVIFGMIGSFFFFWSRSEPSVSRE